MQHATTPGIELGCLAFPLPGDEAIRAGAPEKRQPALSWLDALLVAKTAPLPSVGDCSQTSRIRKIGLPQREWRLDANTSWTEFESALLAIERHRA